MPPPDIVTDRTHAAGQSVTGTRMDDAIRTALHSEPRDVAPAAWTQWLSASSELETRQQEQLQRGLPEALSLVTR